MKISYCITCCNETDTLIRLLECIGTLIKDNKEDECIILIDSSKTDNQPTKNILSDFAVRMSRQIVETKQCKIYEFPLNNDYSSFKNFFIQRATGDWIFSIDGDELPPESLLGENLHALLENNPSMEAYAVPRINDFKGVTLEHALRFGWKLTESQKYKRPVVNWPDPQWRIFKRDYPRIRFKRKLHEKIEGYRKFSILPYDEEYALYHDKTIEQQIATNSRYNKDFTEEENKGHKPI